MTGYGIHVLKGKHKSILSACMDAYETFGSNVMQIFTGVPRMSKLIAIDPPGFRHWSDMNGVRVYGHSSYITSAWGKIDDSFVRKVTFLGQQCKLVADAGLQGLVLHVPKMDAKEAVSSLAAVMKFLEKEKDIDVPILLEHKPIIPGKTSLESASKINRLMTHVAKSGINARFVIDSGHVFAGKVPIKTDTDVARYLSAIADPAWIGLLHLNGNSVGDKHFKDKHCVPLSDKDKIWNDIPFEYGGLSEFLSWGERHGIDAIYETHDPDIEKDDIIKLFTITGHRFES